MTPLPGRRSYTFLSPPLVNSGAFFYSNLAKSAPGCALCFRSRAALFPGLSRRSGQPCDVGPRLQFGLYSAARRLVFDLPCASSRPLASVDAAAESAQLVGRLAAAVFGGAVR